MGPLSPSGLQRRVLKPLRIFDCGASISGVRIGVPKFRAREWQEGGGSNGLGRRTLRLHGSRTTSSQVCNARWNPRCLAMSTRGRDVGTVPHSTCLQWRSCGKSTAWWWSHPQWGLQAPAGAQGSERKATVATPGKALRKQGDLARNATPPAFAATTTRPPQECLQSFAHKNYSMISTSTIITHRTGIDEELALVVFGSSPSAHING